MTSQTRSRLEYSVPTYNVLMFLLHSKLIYKFSLNGGIAIRFKVNSGVAYFLLGHPVHDLTPTRI